MFRHFAMIARLRFFMVKYSLLKEEYVMRKILIALGIVLIAGIIVFLLLAQNASVYTTEIESTVVSVNRINAPLTLAVFSDIHHDPEDKVDPLPDMTRCLPELFSRCRIDALWNLGDLINGHNCTKEQATNLLREVIAAEQAVTEHYHNIEGNHDNNIQSTWEGSGNLPESVVLSNGELSAVLSNEGEVHSTLRGTDYYVDFPDQHIRVICVTAEYTAFRPETAEWLRSTALKTDYDVLVLAHCPTRPEWGFKDDIVNGELIEAELKAFVESGGTVIAYIHGHDHGDMIETADDLAWTGVAVGCARFQVPASNGTEGMIYQDRYHGDATRLLFDIVCIDPENRQVHFIRFGAGQDRVISY